MAHEPPESRTKSRPASDEGDWPRALYRVLKEARVRQVGYVPDAGHARLIDLLVADPDVISNVLTTEEEGIAIAAGAWLGGDRAVVLMQSSGAGNCINMTSLATMGRFPLLLLVTMRGEWAEFNPWQVPVGLGIAAALNAVGVRTMRAESDQDIVPIVRSACTMAYEADQQIAVLISQRALGAKKW